MSRRSGHPLYGVRYCGNRSPSKRELHDLDNEKAVCQIDEIIRAGNAVPFQTQSDGNSAGYDNCAYCIGGSKR